MPIGTLKCPMCGAPAAPDSTRCDHCGAHLATVACPSCFGTMFVGQEFCPSCGAKAARAELPGDTHEPCPRCRTRLQAVVIGNSELSECPRCEGIWADAETLKQLCSDREKQAAVLGVAGGAPPQQSSELEAVRYVPCPVCKKLMNRVNFAHCSNVVVDICSLHGTWFDKNELRRIVEFIRAGGLEKARSREIADLAQQKRELEAARAAGGSTCSDDLSLGGTWSGSSKYDGMDAAISMGAMLLKGLFK